MKRKGAIIRYTIVLEEFVSNSALMHMHDGDSVEELAQKEIDSVVSTYFDPSDDNDMTLTVDGEDFAIPIKSFKGEIMDIKEL